MKQIGLQAVFMRGGTSRGVVFRQDGLPSDRELWPEIFRAIMGSPDPYGRQLDGMGGGISSLSKVCVVGRSTRADADLDYTFAQVGVQDDIVDFSGNCGNMSAAVGPFAVDEGLVAVNGERARVRIHNTNTGKLILASFALESGTAAVDGEFEIAGVAGKGAPIQLEFLEPGGSATHRLLPTGHPRDRLSPAPRLSVDASLVDAAVPCVFVPAAQLGMTAAELPQEIDARDDLLRCLEAIRQEASLLMGLAKDREAAARKPAIPKVGVVGPPRSAVLLSGVRQDDTEVDVSVRMLSMGRAHRAVPLTAAMCLAVAAQITGSVVQELASPRLEPGRIRVGHPSGTTVVGATVRYEGEWKAVSASVVRTARRLMAGTVYLRAHVLSENARRALLERA